MAYQQKYPLPAAEKRELIKATVLSEAIIFCVAAVALVAIYGAVTGDWFAAFISGWWQCIIAALGPVDSVGAIVPVASSVQSGVPIGEYLSAALIVGAVVGLFMICLLVILDKAGRRWSRSYVESMRKLRQGITGELIRLPMTVIVPCMLLAGFVEELAFRFVLLNVLIALGALFMPFGLACALALVVTSLAFWLIHEQYRDVFSSSIVICAGLVLGSVYLITGWILVPMTAHALYNILEILIEKRAMTTEDDYFFGAPPEDVLIKMGQASKGE